MKRIPLYQLLALIAVVGLDLAAIRSGSLSAVRLSFALLMVLLLTAVLGALLRARPFGAWLGFALFGGVSIVVITIVAPLTQVLGFNTFYMSVFVMDDLAEYVHPEPPTPAGVDPNVPLLEDDPNPRIAAYARVMYQRPERVRNSAAVITLTICLVMGLIGAIAGRVLEARRAVARPD